MKATEGGKLYDVVISSSIGVNPGYVLVNNTKYPGIADDYRRAFEVMRSLHNRFGYGLYRTDAGL